MIRILLSSPKGGVGRTTITANLAAALQKAGWRVTVLELDPQNTLSDLLAPGAENREGLLHAMWRARDWREALIATRSGAAFAPFGAAPPQARDWFESGMGLPGLEAGLARLSQGSGDLMLIDSPAGGGRLRGALQAHVDAVLHLFLPDAGSMAALRVSEARRLLQPIGRERPLHLGLINALDPKRRLHQDVADFLREALSERLLPAVRHDEALAEAHAQNLTLFDHDARAAAAADLARLAEALASKLTLWLQDTTRTRKSLSTNH